MVTKLSWTLSSSSSSKYMVKTSTSLCRKRNAAAALKLVFPTAMR